MEIGRVSDTSVKIKTKNALILIDPKEKSEADVVLFTQPDQEVDASAKLIISGPGEYEMAGVSIKVESFGNQLVYTLLEEMREVLIVPSPCLKKVEEEGEGNTILVKAVERLEESMLSGFSTSTVVVYGDPANIALAEVNIKKVNKINLKKKEEFAGSIVVLSN